MIFVVYCFYGPRFQSNPQECIRFSSTAAKAGYSARGGAVSYIALVEGVRNTSLGGVVG